MVTWKNFGSKNFSQSEVRPQSYFMADTEPPEMTNVEQPKRDFKTVTTTKTRLVKAIKACEDDEVVIEYIQNELPKALEEYVSVVMELAGLDTKIQEKQNYKFLGKLDFRSMVTEDRIIDSKVKETKILSLIDEVQRSNATVGKGCAILLLENRLLPKGLE